MLDKLKTTLITLFSSLNTDEGNAVAAVLSRWGLDFGFNRTGNSTDHKTWKGQTQSRVSLDTYADGSPCIVINRTMAESWRHVFASAVHGAILAWRKDSGAKTADGKERLIDEAFNKTAAFVGLTKIAETRKVNGKEVKVGDGQRRAWYGLSASLMALADSFAAEIGELPPAYAGTEESTSIGTVLLPAFATLADGSTEDVFIRIPSYTAAEKKREAGETATNAALDRFAKLRSCKSLRFNEKNKGFKLMVELSKPTVPVAEPVAAAEPEPESEKHGKGDRKRHRQPEARI